MTERMRAAVRELYGLPDVITLRDVARPSPGPNEVLIRVQAVSINASDIEFLTGTPVYVRMWGARRPKIKILGSDVAGTVTAVGEQVTRFSVGDAVFGDISESFGGLAEYVVAPAERLTRKPLTMRFVQAAAIPQAALVALQCLREVGQLRAGERVLINGAGGGAGTFALQLARYFGAHITAVDTAEKFEVMRALGAHEVVDYTREDFTRGDTGYDLIVDLVARRSLFDILRALRPGGTYVLAGGSMRAILCLVLLGPLLAWKGKRLRLLMLKANRGLDLLCQLFESRDVVPVIDRSYPLSEAQAALRHVLEGRARGKVVVRVADDAALEGGG